MKRRKRKERIRGLSQYLNWFNSPKAKSKAEVTGRVRVVDRLRCSS